MKKLLTTLALSLIVPAVAVTVAACEPATPTLTETEATDTLATEAATESEEATEAAERVSTEPEPEGPPPLYLALTVHLEGWPVEKKEAFQKYVGKIREYSDLTHTYGARFTWETQNLIEPSVTFDDNILHELQVERGDGVGVHADAGGNPSKPGLTQESFTDEIQAMKEAMEDLGVEVRHVSGICSHLDWVTAAIDAGYEASTGAVEYCLKSLPIDEQPPEVQSCSNPSQCHDPYPSEQAAKLQPWRVADGATWTTPTPAGGLLLMHSSGSLPCLAESATGGESKTKCEWDQADVDQAMAQLESALAARQSGKMNHFVFVWSFGQAIDPELLGQLLGKIQERVETGDIVWKTMPELADLTTAWEAGQ